MLVLNNLIVDTELPIVELIRSLFGKNSYYDLQIN